MDGQVTHTHPPHLKFLTSDTAFPLHLLLLLLLSYFSGVRLCVTP